MTAHDPFATTIQKTNTMLAEIEREMRWSDRRRAWAALRVVLHVLRDRLTTEEAVSFGAQLPMLVRGAYYENWHPRRKPERIRTRDEFYARVRAELPDTTDTEIEKLTKRVLMVISDHISLGEVEHIARVLPREISALWAA